MSDKHKKTDITDNAAKKPVKKRSRLISNILLITCIAVFVYSAYQLWQIADNYIKEGQDHKEVMEFKPEIIGDTDETPVDTGEPDSTADPGQTDSPQNTAGATQKVKNPSIARAKKEVTEDFVGWLTIPNTKIDYPFMQSNDNEHYLHRDIYGDYLFAGSLFLDCRSKSDFTSFNSIIYGHNMNNGSKFGTLKKFANSDFFKNNTKGTIYLSDENLTLEIFAYLVVNSKDEIIYNTVNARGERITNFHEYVKKNAKQYRDVELKDGDRVVTLSTCANDSDDSRFILVAKIK